MTYVYRNDYDDIQFSLLYINLRKNIQPFRQRVLQHPALFYLTYFNRNYHSFDSYFSGISR